MLNSELHGQDPWRSLLALELLPAHEFLIVHRDFSQVSTPRSVAVTLIFGRAILQYEVCWRMWKA